MRAAAISASLAFIATVWGANYFVENIGREVQPGLHVLPVLPGVDAPSGIVMVGAGLTLRDVVQRLLGVNRVLVLIAVGGAATFFLSPRLAIASTTAFLVSELLDLTVYTRLEGRGWVLAALVSNVAGAAIDSAVFLSTAFGIRDGAPFILANTLGKIEWSIIAIPALRWSRRLLPEASRAFTTDAVRP